jgi:cold shock CspA family protein
MELLVTAKPTGHVVTVNSDRGFCFIQPDSSADNVFAHFKEFKKSRLADPMVGMRYSFNISAEPRGPRAVDLEAE